MTTNKDQIAQDGFGGVEWTRAVQLAVIALVSAVLTATLVIGIGGAWLGRTAHSPPKAEAIVPAVRTNG